MFKDCNVVITGGSSGFGLALAQALASRGACLTLLSRDSDKLRSAVQSIRAAHPRAMVHAHAVDVTDEDAVASTIEQIGIERQRIDMLFNNAGIMREGRFEELGEDDFRDVMATNFFGAVTVTRAALPHLRASRGRLINIASVAGLTGTFGFTAYSAAKHALVGFTECLYYELEPQGIRVHLVCPAEFDSAMVAALDRCRTPENRAHTMTIPRVGIDTVVRDTLSGVRRGKYCIVSGASARVATSGARVSPPLARWIGRARVRGASKR